MAAQVNFDPGVTTTEGFDYTEPGSNNGTSNGIVDRWSLDKVSSYLFSVIGLYMHVLFMIRNVNHNYIKVKYDRC